MSCSEVQTIIVDAKQGKERIDKYLRERFGSVSRTKIQKAIEERRILVNRHPVYPNYQIKPRDEVLISYSQKPPVFTLKAENIPLKIVYEDEDLLVVYKPTNMVVHPSYGNWTGTLVNALAYRFENLPMRDMDTMKPGVVHRIDKNTSGLLLAAKNMLALDVLSEQFREHTIDRNYYALVWGVPKDKTGTITTNIKRSETNRKKFTTCLPSEGGKYAITHYEVVESFHFCSLVKCRLETGRTHQIRVHFQYLGHPIFGDTSYGGDRIVKGDLFSHYKKFATECLELMPHQALHAYSLGFTHPRSKERKLFTHELPDNFQEVLQRWREFVLNPQSQYAV